jgi:hypothetical protein
LVESVISRIKIKLKPQIKNIQVMLKTSETYSRKDEVSRSSGFGDPCFMSHQIKGS